MNTPTYILDEWDFKLIRLFKTGRAVDEGECRRLWAERCNMEPAYISYSSIVFHLAELVSQLCPESRRDLYDLIEDAHPDNAWKFGGDYVLSKDSYWERWLRVLASRLALTEVRHLPGYREWIEKQTQTTTKD